MTDLVPTRREVVGTEGELRAYLAGRVAAGRLLTPIPDIHAEPLASGKFRFVVTVLDAPPVLPKRTMRDRWITFNDEHEILAAITKVLVFWAIIAVALGGTLIGLGLLLFHATSHLLGPALKGGVGFLILVAVLVGVAHAGWGHRGHSGKGWHYTDCK